MVRMRLALFQPDIPQNVGAAMRLAACFDCALDIVEPCGFPLTDRAVRRTAMDYAASAQVSRHASWGAYRNTLDQHHQPHRLILLTTAGETPLWDVRFRPGDIIVCGRESAGAPADVHAQADVRVRIPLAPTARSLNVATAAAIALAEAARQCRAFVETDRVQDAAAGSSPTR